MSARPERGDAAEDSATDRWHVELGTAAGAGHDGFGDPFAAGERVFDEPDGCRVGGRANEVGQPGIAVRAANPGGEPETRFGEFGKAPEAAAPRR